MNFVVAAKNNLRLDIVYRANKGRIVNLTFGPSKSFRNKPLRQFVLSELSGFFRFIRQVSQIAQQIIVERKSGLRIDRHLLEPCSYRLGQISSTLFIKDWFTFISAISKDTLHDLVHNVTYTRIFRTVGETAQ